MTKQFVKFTVNKDIAKYADSFAKVGNVGLSKMDTRYTKALAEVFNGNLIVSGKPLGNQKTFLKVGRKPDVNGSYNVNAFHNFGILGHSIERLSPLEDEEQTVISWKRGKSVEADVVANIIGASYELALMANPIREEKKVINAPRAESNASMVHAKNLKKPLESLGIYDGSDSRIGAWYASDKSVCHEIAKTLKAELEKITSIEVEDYNPPKEKESTKSALFCVSGCELNDLMSLIVKKADNISSAQDLLQCKQHGQNFATEIIEPSKLDQEIEDLITIQN